MNWHSGLPSLLRSTSDVLMSDRFSEFGFPLSSNPPSPSLSPALSPVHIDSFDTWQEATYSRNLLTTLDLQAMDTDDNHYSGCEGSGNGSGYESDMFTGPQEMHNSQGMLQIPVRSHEMSSFHARYSPYSSSPSPQPQPLSLHPLDNSLVGTPVAGSPSPQHIDAAQFRVLMNEATNRIKALAEADYVSLPQPSLLAANVGFISPNNPTAFPAYVHSVPRVYLGRSNSVESLVAEPASTWTTAEQIGQINCAQILYQHQQQQQQHLQNLELQHQQNQHQQMVDYPISPVVTMIPAGNVNHMNQPSINMVHMHIGSINSSNAYEPMAIVDSHLSRVSDPMPMVMAIRNRRPLSAVYKPPVNKFICKLPGCGRTFSRQFNLKSHGMTHETLRPYPCDQCDKTFARIHDRDRHLKSHHEKAHFCVVCQGKFARQDAVTRHLKLAEEKNPCAVILKENGASFRDAAAGRITRSRLGNEVVLRSRFQELEDHAKKIKATKTLEKGMLSMQLLTMDNRTPLNIPQMKHQQLQLQTPMSSASRSPSTPYSYLAGGRGLELASPHQ
ncbi:hypothetical protein KI688_006116 [Linnemannia hyalina]|uniref:C2H2-type domain-containing protein n=1 Tax=Linnemannia hyalina TaxID=64524 RepID=A0A9P7Y364_9FUNG|nr:hypothetical protein KI688_006116 [Linnemannia hyalina]